MQKHAFISNSETLEDMVFENRNKAYGAYALNKKRSRFLAISLLISLIMAFIMVAIPFIQAKNTTDNKPEIKIIKGITLKEPADQQIDIPIPDIPKSIDNKKIAYTAPTVVEEVDLNTDVFLTNDDYEDIVNNEPVDFNELAPVIEPTPEIEEPNNDFVMIPQEFATFGTGGLREFCKWVGNNIVYPPIAIDNGIFGKVIVEFCVDRKGKVMDIKIVRGLDQTINEEVIRVLQSSPKWFPAKNGGVPVKQKFIMPINFSVEAK